MFKLVGMEDFAFLSNGQEHHASISIEPSGFNYTYSLLVDGKPVETFTKNLRRVTQTWRFPLDGVEHSVVFGGVFSPRGSHAHDEEPRVRCGDKGHKSF